MRKKTCEFLHFPVVSTMSQIVTGKAHINDIELLKIDQNLSNQISELTSVVRRSRSTPEQYSELIEARPEIIENARKGVKIASQAQSLPLIQLFNEAKVELPPEFKVANMQNYNFYLVQVTFSTLLERDQFPLSAELDITIKDNVEKSERRVHPIRLFPGRRDIQYFNADIEGAIGIDANMNIVSPVSMQNVVDFAKVMADARLKARFVVGPFQFHFRKTVIEVSGVNDQNVLWRYNDLSENTGTNDFTSALVLKVAKEASDIKMEVSVGIVPCKRKWFLVKDLLPKLSDHMILPIEILHGEETKDGI
jgi:hypothetical protein